MRRFRVVGLFLAVLVPLLIFLTYKGAPVAIDHRNPKSVLRGYFDAWGRNDWKRQASLMDAKYSNMVEEPVYILHPLWIRCLSSTANETEFSVIFFIDMAGQGLSMESGLYSWTYTLTWDKNKESWLITSYGMG